MGQIGAKLQVIRLPAQRRTRTATGQTYAHVLGCLQRRHSFVWACQVHKPTASASTRLVDTYKAFGAACSLQSGWISLCWPTAPASGMPTGMMPKMIMKTLSPRLLRPERLIWMRMDLQCSSEFELGSNLM